MPSCSEDNLSFKLSNSKIMCTDTLKISNGNRTEWSPIQSVIAFVKERFHNAVEIDILGIFEGYSSLQIWPPKTFFRGEIIQGE